jgi:cytochrome c biogenesis protein CcdA
MLLNGTGLEAVFEILASGLSRFAEGCNWLLRFSSVLDSTTGIAALAIGLLFAKVSLPCDPGSLDADAALVEAALAEAAALVFGLETEPVLWLSNMEPT